MILSTPLPDVWRSQEKAVHEHRLKPVPPFGKHPSFLLALLMVALAPLAHAGFIDQYPLSSFTLVNSPNTQLTNGFATMSGDSIVLTGGNSGSGEPGTTDLTTTILTTGVIQFMWSYASLDIPNADYGGYLLNGLLFPLAEANGASGTVMLNVTAGQIFGFEVGTTDNEFEPGILTISSVPGLATPEPATGSILPLALSALVAAGVLRNFKMKRVG